VLIGHYWGDGMAKVELTGRISGQPKTYSTEFAFPAKTTANPELERLWAYATVEALQSEMADFGEKADLKRAATDIALEYSLVSDYTSMLVLRENQFAANNIKRTNQTRVRIEETARQQRAQTAPVSHRVDTQQPMSSGYRPSFSRGGGAVDGWSVLALLGLLAMTMRLRRQNGR